MPCFAAVGRMALLSALAVFATRTAVAAEPKNLLSNGGAEEPADRPNAPPGWFAAAIAAPELQMFIDDRHSRAGNASLAITNQHRYDHTVCNNWAQKVDSIPKGKTVRLTGYLRTDDAEAVNLCVQCWADNGQRMIGFASTPIVRGTQGWTLAKAADLVVPRETTLMMVRAALTGKGTALFDDVSLEIVDRSDAGILDPSDPQFAHRIVRRIPVNKDCMVLSYLAGWMGGDIDNLAVFNHGGTVRTLLAWDPPSRDEIEREDLRFVLALFSKKTLLHGEPGPIEVHKLLDDWRESACWNSQPRFLPEAGATFDLQPGAGWKLFDVTDLVREQARTPQTDHGVVLCLPEKNTTEDDWSQIDFASRECQTQSLRPTLLVVKP
jgi:hypothetical protein